MMKYASLLLTGLVLSVTSFGQPAPDALGTGFMTPPNAAKPRVWWHWMNGNITKEGITKDLEWMKRVGVQCALTDTVDDWPDDRIWSELQIRLGGTSPDRTEQGWRLQEGPILEKSITPMRSFVSEPMQHGRLFLAGDSAHIVPPTGAKGLNMAVADAGQLFDALLRWYRDGSMADLDTYTACCMRRVWRVQEFSNFMTELMHHDPVKSLFDQALQASRFNQLITSRVAASIVAENYVGLAGKRASESLMTV